MQPLFRGRVHQGDGGLLIEGRDGAKVMPAPHVDPTAIVELTRLLDGRRTLAEVRAASEAWFDGNALQDVVAELDKHGFIDDASVPASRSGLDVLFDIELLTYELCARTLFQNEFWSACLQAETQSDFPLQVAHGLVIENYHFLFRESYFDAPVLSFVGNTQVRLALNEFFREEYGHDEILLRSLNHIGLTRADLADSVPLPETLGLCNALAYWALNDPIFFFTTLGLLEGQGAGSDSFIDACERIGVDPAFTKHLRTHSEININSNHGDLARRIFGSLDAIDYATAARLKSQTHLFVGLYDEFYRAVWRHYSQRPFLLRRVSEL